MMWDKWQPSIRRVGSQSGFTVPELLVASTVFVLLVGGIISANLFGLRMSQLVQTKLDNSGKARQIIGPLEDQIRTCKSTAVGSVSNGVFAACLDNEPQLGSALIIYPTTNTANYTLYYLNLADRSFRQMKSASPTTTILARGITNTLVFSAQDCLGNILTNSQNNRVIHFTLEFFRQQPYLPTSDYSQIETSVTKRALE